MNFKCTNENETQAHVNENWKVTIDRTLPSNNKIIKDKGYEEKKK